MRCGKCWGLSDIERENRKLRVGTATTCERVDSWQNEAMIRNFTNVGIIWIMFYLQSGIY